MFSHIAFIQLAVFLMSNCCISIRSTYAQKPNIVLIMADDLGYGDLGCYGNEVNPTPHIDALASGGLRFRDFHAAGPMCSPTRAATLTGLYQQRFGGEFDTALGSRDQLGLPHAAVTIAELLKPLGYAAACFGKWHLGYRPPLLPTNQGFDLFRGLGSGDGDFHTHIDRAGNEDWWHNNQLEMVEGYTTDLLTRYSIEFIETHRESPFFLYVPHLAIHFPWQGPNDPGHRVKGTNYDDDKWGIIPDRSNVAPHVKAMIESLDESVGKIIETLTKLQLADNTLVIFTSDNGGYITYGQDFKSISSNGVLRGQKTELYEGGHRVPAIISLPGKIKPSVTDATVHSIDILPTIAALTGIGRDNFTTDGIDLLPLLLGGQELPERSLYWRARSQSAVRSGPWKLFRNDQRTELYNLNDDPGEQIDLATQHPQLVARLLRDWQAWETEVNSSVANYKGSK